MSLLLRSNREEENTFEKTENFLQNCQPAKMTMLPLISGMFVMVSKVQVESTNTNLAVTLKSVKGPKFSGALRYSPCNSGSTEQLLDCKLRRVLSALRSSR